MKSIISTLILLGVLAVPLAGLAETTAPKVPVMEALDRIVNWLFTILLVVAVIFLIVAGFNFVTAQGDPEKVSTARTMVLYALLGLIVGFLARGLVDLVGKIVGAPGF